MKRRIIWSLTACLALLVLGGVWFLQNFEQVRTEAREGPKKEALRNPHLALERLFSSLGRPVRRIGSSAALDALGNGGVLILDQQRRRNIDAARAGHLLDWVQAGGYLILAAESSGDDPLIARLGLSWNKATGPAQCKPDADEGNETSTIAPGASPPAMPKPKPPETITLNLPDSAIRYRMQYHGSGLGASQPAPQWRHDPDSERSSVLHYAWGQGNITVFTEIRFLDNEHIEQHDHAELIWALLQRYQPQGEVRLASRMSRLTLWQWLAESATLALIGTACLIVLFLWRSVPRFGGTLATPAGERRELAQHLAAIGRSVWREGGITHWLKILRQALQQRLALRHPHLKDLASDARLSALAKLGDCNREQLALALSADALRSARDFTVAVQTLQRIDQHL